MSVIQDQFVVYGIHLPYTNEMGDKLEDIEEFKVGKFASILDGMSGEYIIVGVIMAHASGNNYDGFGITAISPEDIDEYKSILDKELPTYGLPTGNYKIIALTHFH